MPAVVARRRYFSEQKLVRIRATPTESLPYGRHVHVATIDENGNGWTDAHADGTRHRLRWLEFLPAKDDAGVAAADAHVHDIAGRAR